MKLSLRKKINEWGLVSPSLIWLLIFFLIPTLIILIIAFKPANPDGSIGSGWTLRTLLSLSNPNYPEIIGRTILLSIGTTIVTLVLSIPIAYYIARCSPRLRNCVLFLTILPFWTNFLIRIFAWKQVLHPNGPLCWLLIHLGLLAPGTLLYSSWTVLLVMIYTELPFAILPLYSAAEKFDFTLMEAAMDLGASRFLAFRRIFIPGIRSGLSSACIIVLIPSFGSYVISDVVGNLNSRMLGNVIQQTTFVDRNLPAASALSAVLILAMFIPLLLILNRRRLNEKNQNSKPAKEVLR